MNEISWGLVKTLAKTAAKTALAGLSFVGDKVAEYSDDAKEYIEDLDKKDTSGRDARTEKRKNS